MNRKCSTCYLLVRQAGRLVTRDEIVETVWQGRIVSESAISARIAAARKAVGDDRKTQAVIRTVSRRGLKLVAEVTTTGAAHTSPPRPSRELPKLRFARADDGTRLAYTVTGSGPPLLLFDYFPGDTLGAWSEPSERPLIDAFNANFTQLRFDQRGCGMSERDIDSFDLETLADDARTLVDAAGFDRFAVHAHSGACLSAITFAARYPERVTRMALVGGYVEGRLIRRDSRDKYGEVFRTMLAEGWEDPGSAFISALMAAYMPEGPSEMLQSIAAFVQKNTTAKIQLLDRDLINSACVIDCLPHITAPTLVINARRDAVHPLSQGQKLAAGLPNGELLVYDTANHVPIPGHRLWNRYVEDVIGFLAQP